MAEEIEAPQPHPELINPDPNDQSLPPAPAPPSLTAAAPSLTIWPPSQRTRDAVSNRLVDTLSSPSVLSKRYGTIPRDEAAAAAKAIEEAAFEAASSAADGDRAASVDGGIEILELYSKEISKRMLECVKARDPPAAVPAASPTDTASEEAVSVVESEASAASG